AVLEYRDTSRFNYGAAAAGASLVEITESQYIAAIPGEAARRAAESEAAAKARLLEIDMQSIRSLREIAAAGGDSRLAALESKASSVRVTLKAVKGGGATGGISIEEGVK
ncbi:MAG: hypothetical protein LBF93_13135, partial [Zoogloeaceae bacterium]|nr:hypothetical protein [Zoogloeaceae bacterium]